MTGAVPPVELNLDFATPADVESRLFGKSGLDHGSRRFQAALERMMPAGDDAWRLRTFIKDAFASPTGSELKFEGTVKGAKFKAKRQDLQRRDTTKRQQPEVALKLIVSLVRWKSDRYPRTVEPVFSGGHATRKAATPGA